MLHKLIIKKRFLSLLIIVITLLVLFIYVLIHTGPFSTVKVTTTNVKTQSLSPILFGIGTVEARYYYKVGPIATGRIEYLNAQVGDHVKAGQILGKMDPIDINEQINAQNALIKRVNAQVKEAAEREKFASQEAERYEKLANTHAISEQTISTKRHELLISKINRNIAEEDLSRATEDKKALENQRGNLYLVAPNDSLVVSRNAEPGSTVASGQTVIELIDTNSLWINTRFDQVYTYGLATGLPTEIILRSQRNKPLSGQILRVEPLADAVTEETLAKITFDQLPTPLPPIGEIAEVSVKLPTLSPQIVIPNAAIHQLNNVTGVWKIKDKKLIFTAVELGQSDYKGSVQILSGLKNNDEIIVYSENVLNSSTKIHIVEHL